jgi:hypothetical protein
MSFARASSRRQSELSLGAKFMERKVHFEAGVHLIISDLR